MGFVNVFPDKLREERVLMGISYLQLGFAGIAGMVLGLIYFGGLWVTVKRLSVAARPAILTLSSYLVRLGVTLFGFYFLAEGSWQRLLAMFCGFMVMRVILVRLLMPTGKLFLKTGQRYGTES